MLRSTYANITCERERYGEGFWGCCAAIPKFPRIPIPVNITQCIIRLLPVGTAFDASTLARSASAGLAQFAGIKDWRLIRHIGIPS